MVSNRRKSLGCVVLVRKATVRWYIYTRTLLGTRERERRRVKGSSLLSIESSSSPLGYHHYISAVNTHLPQCHAVSSSKTHLNPQSLFVCEVLYGECVSDMSLNFNAEQGQQ